MASTTTTSTGSSVDWQRVKVERDAAGRLVYTSPEGNVHVGVLPVRAFPLSRPLRGVSIIDTHGHEALWIESLDDLPAQTASVLRDELAQREFRPKISRIVAVSTFATPSSWTVESDRGTHDFVLKAEEDIRRLDGARLLITSGDGVSYEIHDRWALDRASRKLLERFL